MAEGLEKLAALKEDTASKKAAPAAENAAEPTTEAETVAPAEPKIDDLGRAYATGRRKESVARVWIKRGSGKVSVNGKELATYFARPTQQMIVRQPFGKVERDGEFDVVCTVSGGGLSGQAGAVRHGISRALVNFEPGLRSVLKREGLLTRDSRAVERKKFGKPKARRSKQWKKR